MLPSPAAVGEGQGEGTHRHLKHHLRIHPDLAWCLFFGGLGLIYFWRYLGWFGPAMSFGQSDFTILFWPFHDFSVHEMLAGRVPLWNDSIYGGQPHLASIEAGVFYPLSIVELLLAGHGGVLTGIFTRMWLDTWIAATGMYLLVRRLTGDRSAAALAGVAFAFSGFMLGYGANQMDRLEALAFLPLGLFLLDRALLLPRWRMMNAWLAGWCLACTILGGYPQLWLIAPVAVLALVTVRALSFRAPDLSFRGIRGPLAPTDASLDARHDKGGAWRDKWLVSLTVVAAAGLATLSLAAVQLGPSLEFLRGSERSVYLGEGYGYAWRQLLGLLVSGADGDKGMYLGVLPVLLGIAGLVFGRNRRLAVCWLAASVLGLLLALGDTTPLYSLLFSHLGFGLFRGQNRNVALSVLSLAVLGGMGVASLRARYPRFRLAPVLPLLAAVDLMATNWSNNWPADRVTVPVQEQSPHVLAALQAEQQREPMRFVVDRPHEFFVPNESYRSGLESLDGYLNFKVGRSFEVLDKADVWRQWQLFNVRYIVSQRPLTGDGIAEVPGITDGPVRLYKMQFPLPRAYMVWKATVAGSPADALKVTLDPGFDPGSTAVLERPSPVQLAPPAAGEQTVTVTIPDPENLRIQVSAPATGLLVISEPYYPGWEADVDGRPVAFERADYALEAVPVPAGEHLVRLTYKPASFRLGAAVSLASLATFVLVVLVSTLRNRRV
ncbi:MAG: YfhO family protein [Chloroflexota bacterium]